MQGRVLKVRGLNEAATAQGGNGRAQGDSEARMTPSQGVLLGFSPVEFRQGVLKEGLWKKMGHR